MACRASNAVAFAMLALSANHWTGWTMFGAGQLLLGLALPTRGATDSPSLRTDCRDG